MSPEKTALTRLLIAVLWPSFLCAGAFTVVLFAFVDPYALLDAAGLDIGSRLGGYSLAFLSLWISGIVVALFTLYIYRTPPPGVATDSRPSISADPIQAGDD